MPPANHSRNVFLNKSKHQAFQIQIQIVKFKYKYQIQIQIQTLKTNSNTNSNTKLIFSVFELFENYLNFVRLRFILKLLILIFYLNVSFQDKT